MRWEKCSLRTQFVDRPMQSSLHGSQRHNCYQYLLKHLISVADGRPLLSGDKSPTCTPYCSAALIVAKWSNGQRKKVALLLLRLTVFKTVQEGRQLDYTATDAPYTFTVAQHLAGRDLIRGSQVIPQKSQLAPLKTQRHKSVWGLFPQYWLKRFS